MEKLYLADPEVFSSIKQEHHRQQNTLEMIDSENFNFLKFIVILFV